MAFSLHAASRGFLRSVLLCTFFWISSHSAVALPHSGGTVFTAPNSENAATPNSRQLLEEEGVEIEPMVIHLLAIVCGFAFLPPIICKLRQMFCTSKVEDYIEEED